MRTVTRETLQHLDRALELEWLDTNGLGGFASSTVVGINTRRYHGLLVAAIGSPSVRMMILSRVEDAATSRGNRLELASNLYPGAVHPSGYTNLREFRLDPLPTFIYGDATLTLKKTVFMLHDANTVALVYELVEADDPIELEVRPIVAGRDYHHLVAANADIDSRAVAIRSDAIAVAPYPGVPRLTMSLTAGRFDAAPAWYYNHLYPEEAARGLDSREDLFSYGRFVTTLKPGRIVGFVATVEDQLPTPGPASLLDRESERKARRPRVTVTAQRSPATDRVTTRLAESADHFLVRRGTGTSIIAGYPWFTDWTRDAMISLPGLTLVTGRFTDARDILWTFARHVQDGLLPKRFPDGGPAEYDAVDSSLWYFLAARKYLEYTNDLEFLRDGLRPVLDTIVQAYEQGTGYGIRMDDDGLITASSEGRALTWMDARVGDWVVTPRRGKPVEVNALWYHALRFASHLARLTADESTRHRFDRLAERVRESFLRTYWNERDRCLYDCIGEDGTPDVSIRPNQIFALSLPEPLVTAAEARRILAVVERELLTPVGLRTLSPRDPAYCRCYAGDARSRDAAYHQGTVWPWLLGPFVTAMVGTMDRTPASLERARSLLTGLGAHLADAGLGFISEVFDADPPHHPGGCPAQAWSHAEILRALVEDAYAA
jgi:predicted glycogen debranching enzyme